eukprot:11109959-Alexandrium_andersonii.AAC.1
MEDHEKVLEVSDGTDTLDFEAVVAALPNTSFLDLVDQPAPDDEALEEPVLAPAGTEAAAAEPSAEADTGAAEPSAPSAPTAPAPPSVPHAAG